MPAVCSDTSGLSHEEAIPIQELVLPLTKLRALLKKRLPLRESSTDPRNLDALKNLYSACFCLFRNGRVFRFSKRAEIALYQTRENTARKTNFCIHMIENKIKHKIDFKITIRTTIQYKYLKIGEVEVRSRQLRQLGKIKSAQHSSLSSMVDGPTSCASMEYLRPRMPSFSALRSAFFCA
jgi:hypothetical protein